MPSAGVGGRELENLAVSPRKSPRPLLSEPPQRRCEGGPCCFFAGEENQAQPASPPGPEAPAKAVRGQQGGPPCTAPPTPWLQEPRPRVRGCGGGLTLVVPPADARGQGQPRSGLAMLVLKTASVTVASAGLLFGHQVRGWGRGSLFLSAARVLSAEAADRPPVTSTSESADTGQSPALRSEGLAEPLQVSTTHGGPPAPPRRSLTWGHRVWSLARWPQGPDVGPRLKRTSQNLPPGNRALYRPWGSLFHK